MLQRVFVKHIGLWCLLGTNLYLIAYYIKYPDSFSSIVIIYWIQSALIGILNVLDMLTLKNIVSHQGQEKDDVFPTKGCTAAFFAIHYGGFHLGYLIFLFTIINIKAIDLSFIYLSFWLLLINGTINFIQNKIRNRTEAVSIRSMFFMPYARIIPFHLTILIPAFYHISAPLTFLVLKTVTDVFMQMVYQRAVFRPIEKN